MQRHRSIRLYRRLYDLSLFGMFQDSCENPEDFRKIGAEFRILPGRRSMDGGAGWTLSTYLPTFLPTVVISNAALQAL